MFPSQTRISALGVKRSLILWYFCNKLQCSLLCDWSLFFLKEDAIKRKKFSHYSLKIILTFWRKSCWWIWCQAFSWEDAASVWDAWALIILMYFSSSMPETRAYPRGWWTYQSGSPSNVSFPLLLMPRYAEKSCFLFSGRGKYSLNKRILCIGLEVGRVW